MSTVVQGLLASYGGGASARPFNLLDSGLIVMGAAGTSAGTSSIAFPGGNVVAAFGIANAGGNAFTVTGMSVTGGETLAQDVTAVNGVAATCCVWSGSVTAGSRNLGWTMNSSQTYSIAYAVYDIGSRVLQATDSSNAALTALNDTVNVNADGVVVSAYWVSLNNHTSVFNGGVDQDERSAIFATNRYASVGSRLYPTASTPATVTSTAVASNTFRSATASYS